MSVLYLNQRLQIHQKQCLPFNLSFVTSLISKRTF